MTRIWPPSSPQPQPQPQASLPPNATLREQIIHALKGIQDPEIPVNIYDLGLIYTLDIDEPSGRVAIGMTLTNPSCPVADELPGQVRAKVGMLRQVTQVDVDVVWDPPWTRDRMSDDARLILGL